MAALAAQIPGLTLPLRRRASSPALRGERLGGNARGLTPWQSTRLETPGRPPVEITATPCRYGPPLSRPLRCDAIGFAVHGGALWISGDTVRHRGVRDVARPARTPRHLLARGNRRSPACGAGSLAPGNAP
jgi:hypothetical protein